MDAIAGSTARTIGAIQQTRFPAKERAALVKVAVLSAMQCAVSAHIQEGGAANAGACGGPVGGGMKDASPKKPLLPDPGS